METNIFVIFDFPDSTFYLSRRGSIAEDSFANRSRRGRDRAWNHRSGSDCVARARRL